MPATLRYWMLIVICTACSSNKVGQTWEPIHEGPIKGVAACNVTTVRYPTTIEEFSKLYEKRGFYTDGNHLGDDNALPEGTAIHPVACGTIKVYRSAQGYGRLVVVIEHTLPRPIQVANGLGEPVEITTFLSIYGHLQKGSLAWKTGDTVTPDDIVGYVDADATNGDGGVHLHLGIRLQSESDAQATDVSWFRGYDDPYVSQRKWFADPAVFLDTLMKAGLVVRWHPEGTVIERELDRSHWMVGPGDALLALSSPIETQDRLLGRAIPVSESEFGCMWESGGVYASELAGHKLVKFEDESTVYEYDGLHPGARRWSFVNEPAFRSWAWKDTEIQVWSPLLRSYFMSSTTDQGFRRLRDGTLVKAKGQSEVAVVAGGVRLPIYDWSTFLSLGYKAENIVEVEESVLDASAGPRGATITPDLVSLCRHPETCLVDCPDQGPGGGGVGEEDAGQVADDAVAPETDAGSVTGGAGGSPSVPDAASGSGGTSAKPPTCTPGATKACACVGQGLVGSQVCAMDGLSYGPCVCPDPWNGELDSGNGGSPSDAGHQFDAGSSGAGGSGGTSNVPPPDAGSPQSTSLHVAYVSPVSGSLRIEGWTKLQDGTNISWHIVTECADVNPSDNLLECDLPVPSGSQRFEFQVYLPNGKYWGDHACDSGGCGQPLGQLTLTKGGSPVSWTFTPNNAGAPYYNGLVSPVP